MKAISPLSRSWGLAAMLLVAVCGCRESEDDEPNESTVDTGPREVVALGRLEPAHGLVAISAIPGERLQSYFTDIDEGKTVAAGAKLAKLASYDLHEKNYLALQEQMSLATEKRQFEQETARVQRRQAEAALEQANAKLEEIRSQQEMLDTLAEAAAIASQDYRILADLQGQDRDLVTPHQLRKQFNVTDRARKDYEAAKSNLPHALAAAEQAYEAALANYQLADDNVQLLKRINQTKALSMQVDAAALTRDQSLLRAPGDPGDPTQYTILKKFLQPGEFITQTPILQIADLSEMVCVAEVYEADVKEIREQQQVTIESAAFRDRFAGGLKGTVHRIGALVSSPGLTNRNPLAPSDRSVVEVVIKIVDDKDDPSAQNGRQNEDEDRGHQNQPSDAKKPARGGDEKRTATEEAAARVGLQVTVTFELDDDSNDDSDGGAANEEADEQSAP